MNNSIKLLFLWLFLIPCSIAGQVSEERLKEIAEKQGYGYKYANLVLLKEIIEEFNKVFLAMIPIVGFGSRGLAPLWIVWVSLNCQI